MPSTIVREFNKLARCCAEKWLFRSPPEVPIQDLEVDVRVLLVPIMGRWIRATLSYPRRRPPVIVSLGTRFFERVDQAPINTRGPLRSSLRIFRERQGFLEAVSLEDPEPSCEVEGSKKSVWEHLRMHPAI
jgi:hypothetical protein